MADAISRLKIMNLHEKHQEVNLIPSVDTAEDALENIIEEIHNVTIKAKHYNQNTQLHLDELHREQKCYQFCKNKAKGINSYKPSDFILDNNRILRKIVKLKYTVEPTIFIPRKLKQKIIFDFHEGKGHQGITQTTHMIRQ